MAKSSLIRCIINQQGITDPTCYFKQSLWQRIFLGEDLIIWLIPEHLIDFAFERHNILGDDAIIWSIPKYEIAFACRDWNLPGLHLDFRISELKFKETLTRRNQLPLAVILTICSFDERSRVVRGLSPLLIKNLLCKLF